MAPPGICGTGHSDRTFDPDYLTALTGRIFGTMSNETLVAVPLFILMGVVLERAKIAEDLLANMAGLFGERPGGLGVAVIVVGALLAASTGIVGATVVTMGVLALPSMLRRGISRSWQPAPSAPPGPWVRSFRHRLRSFCWVTSCRVRTSRHSSA